MLLSRLMNLDQAIRRAGSINKLAAALGVTRQAIQSYRKHGIPASRLDVINSLPPPKRKR